MCKADEKRPHVTSRFKVNIFWMGKQPFVKDKDYKLKLATQQIPVVLSEILHVLDASELSSIGNKSQVDRHDVAECVLETLKPTAFDEVNYISQTGRFVIVDHYEIVGGGIILAPIFEEETILKKHIQSREFSWERSDITPEKRALQYAHTSVLVVIAGDRNTGKIEIAKALEENLFNLGKFAYFLGISNELLAAGGGSNDKVLEKMRHIQHLGEMAHILTDAGLILITSISNVDQYELDMLKTLNRPNKTIIINVGESIFSQGSVDFTLQANENPRKAAQKISDLLTKIILPDPEFSI
jgi:bifunctional enzyme CysN/CysC